MASPQFFGCIKIIELPNLLSPHLLKKSIDKKMGVTIYYLQNGRIPMGYKTPPIILVINFVTLTSVHPSMELQNLTFNG